MVDFFREQRLEFDGSPNLKKASVDYYEYALGLSNGLVFTFAEVRPNGKFITLIDARPVGNPTGDEIAWGRPIDVRLTEVAWIVDGDS